LTVTKPWEVVVAVIGGATNWAKVSPTVTENGRLAPTVPPPDRLNEMGVRVQSTAGANLPDKLGALDALALALVGAESAVIASTAAKARRKVKDTKVARRRIDKGLQS
jgi:hypothetical protein